MIPSCFHAPYIRDVPPCTPLNIYFVGIGIGAPRQNITQLLTTRYVGNNAIRQRGVSRRSPASKARRTRRQVLWRHHVTLMVN
jgi:hypothetical protein